MRRRGVIFILAALPAWVSLFRFLNQVKRYPCPSRYELGSIAMPLPPFVRVATMFAFLSTLIGLYLFVFDLTH
jgi:formate-dependent nitrite reductase membrane component NrfD